MRHWQPYRYRFRYSLCVFRFKEGESSAEAGERCEPEERPEEDGLRKILSATDGNLNSSNHALAEPPAKLSFRADERGCSRLGGLGQRLRIISVRRARDEEEDIYNQGQ